MAYLHEDKELFKNAIDLASSQFGILPPIVEKDYYVTMVLRELSAHVPFIVFKGGTSLSKCHKVIKRFSVLESEDNLPPQSNEFLTAEST